MTVSAPESPRPEREPPSAAVVPVTPVLPPVLDDATRQRNLDQMKWRASALLVVSAAVFLVASYFENGAAWIGYVRAAAEAAVIGGLADWFAVTALFRHPLGIPIPHTAILPSKKDRLGRTLGTFVQNHFLSRDVLSDRLRSLRLAERAARWLSEPENSRQIARQVASGLGKTVEALPDAEIKALLHRAVVGRLRAMHVAPLLGSALTLVRSGNRHQDLLSEAVRIAARALDENRESIRDSVKSKSPWWIPGVVDNKIYGRIVVGVETMLDEIRENPEHPLRAKFDEALDRFVDQLESSPETIAKAEALKEQLLTGPVVEEFTTWLWEHLREAAVSKATDPESPSALERGIEAFGRSLLGNQAMMDRIDDFLVERALGAVEQYRGDAADLIAQTVAKWDPVVTSRRIELAIGRDLQFIRINGTLVGGLLGLLIHTVKGLLK